MTILTIKRPQLLSTKKIGLSFQVDVSFQRTLRHLSSIPLNSHYCRCNQRPHQSLKQKEKIPRVQSKWELYSKEAAVSTFWKYLIAMYFAAEAFDVQSNGEILSSRALSKRDKSNISPANDPTSLGFPTKLSTLLNPTMEGFCDESRFPTGRHALLGWR